ncbi:hypothetical protein Y1Q_0001807 [Alligator mississippiensis]|uniref:Uncharacterized protein n=1 Tax=Alligator mississippiensis TaxID=8496 RepID=A0A151MKV5_ALLMI|nr:hypothetical protein Y1Q_0001807 [Alligator mississippiensis]
MPLVAGMDQGLMTLLYKKGLRGNLKNWRPTTLLNFDYNLLAKVLAECPKSIIGVKTLTREVVLFEHLIKQQETPTAHCDQFICFRNALWKTRNLLIYKHTNLSVKDCVRMGLSEIQLYYKKSVEDDGKEMLKIIWKRGDWHRLFKSKTPKEDNNNDDNDDKA